MWWLILYATWYRLCFVFLLPLLVGQLNDDQGVEPHLRYDQGSNQDLESNQKSDNDQDLDNVVNSDNDQDSDNNQDLNTTDDQDSDDERSSSDDDDRSNDQSNNGEGSNNQGSHGKGSIEQGVISTKWKEGLVKKSLYHKKRLHLQRLIYSVISAYNPAPSDDDGNHANVMAESEGVLLRHHHDDQQTLVQQCDSSCVVRSAQGWSTDQVTALRTLCVTGSWGDEDAAMQLQSSSDEDVAMEMDDDELVAKKQKLKTQFNEDYDNKGQDGGQDYFSEMKERLTAQVELNKSTFDGVADELRWQLEGFPAGCYVRMEIKGIPCELIERFDPRLPLIVGGLSPGEDQLSYLQVGVAKCMK